MIAPSCRFCQSPLRHTFVDLGMSPLCESYVQSDQLNQMEPYYPLHAYVCDECFLVQLQEYVSPTDIFSHYAYLSSCSDSWLEHVSAYTDMVLSRFALPRDARVVEVGSNDGYLLHYFLAAGRRVLGIEPAGNVARLAIQKGIPTVVGFFDAELARRLRQDHQADLLIGNNVLAQVPNLNGFVAGLKTLLSPTGIITMEFPHLMRLMEGNQFDTIYHEHFSYFSLTTVARVFSWHDLTVFDVEELPTHGGSLRIYARHSQDASRPMTSRTRELLAVERAAGLTRLETYASFSENVKETKRKLLQFLIRVKREGRIVAGYGAPGKGNTLLNYCGIGTDFIDYTVDRNPQKQGAFTPGTHIPIYHPDKLRERTPDYILILPWNLRDEIIRQLSWLEGTGTQFVVPIPEVRVYPATRISSDSRPSPARTPASYSVADSIVREASR